MISKLSKITALIMVLAAISAAETLDTAAIMKKAYNVRGGLNFSSHWAYRSVVGFHAGVMVDHPLTLIDLADEPYLMEFHYGAQFIKKGGRWGWGLYSNYGAYDAYYIEAPLLFSLKKKFSETVSGRVDLGPYLALGLFGTKNIFDYLDRFDAGVIYGATMDFQNKYNIGFHMGSGLDLYTLYMTFGCKL